MLNRTEIHKNLQSGSRKESKTWVIVWLLRSCFLPAIWKSCPVSSSKYLISSRDKRQGFSLVSFFIALRNIVGLRPNCKRKNEWKLMSGSSHIRSVLIGVEYRNCCQTFAVDLLLLFGWGKFNQNWYTYLIVTYELASL